jgi:hypothetical protein
VPEDIFSAVKRLFDSSFYRIVIRASRLPRGIHPPYGIASLSGLTDGIMFPRSFRNQSHNYALFAPLIPNGHELQTCICADQMGAFWIYCVDQVVLPNNEVWIEPPRAALFQ